MKKVLYFLGVLLLLLVLVILVRTFTIRSRQVKAVPAPGVQVSDSVIARLGEAIRYPTVSHDRTGPDTAAFTGFHLFLQKAFPRLHRQLQVEAVNRFSLLYHWKGKNSGKKPVILVAHQDVVPVEEASLPLWKAPPFGGAIQDGAVWGRGAVDDKGSLMALLEGVEKLLSEGFQPECDVYLALGHDEEAKGLHGAQAIVALLQQRNLKPAFVLDEGGEITAHEVPGLHKPVALIGIAEKGYVTLDLELAIPGGHSSMPGKQTVIDQLAKAVVKLQENPFPATLNASVQSFMDYMGPEMPFVQRMAFANRWLFSPLIKNTYSSKPGANAMIRTTTALTLMASGVKENVIPSVARATVNFRTLPGTGAQEVVRHVKEVIADERIRITVRPGGSSPEAVANVKDPSFLYLQQAIRNWRTDVVVAPYLMLGASDGRYYTALTPQVYRFIPFNDIQGFHGINEKVGIAEYKKAIGFYYGLIKGLRG